jgi:hypothetical protein
MSLVEWPSNVIFYTCSLWQCFNSTQLQSIIVWPCLCVLSPKINRSVLISLKTNSVTHMHALFFSKGNLSMHLKFNCGFSLMFGLFGSLNNIIHSNSPSYLMKSYLVKQYIFRLWLCFNVLFKCFIYSCNVNSLAFVHRLGPYSWPYFSGGKT